MYSQLNANKVFCCPICASKSPFLLIEQKPLTRNFICSCLARNKVIRECPDCGYQTTPEFYTWLQLHGSYAAKYHVGNFKSQLINVTPEEAINNYPLQCTPIEVTEALVALAVLSIFGGEDTKDIPRLCL